jgi:3-oxoacyl-[acyl-carrier protein] reductase
LKKVFDLTDKNIVVTGATGGIGAALSKALHAQGANLILTGTHDDERLTGFISELGSRAHGLKCDLLNLSDVESLLERAIQIAGQIDGLICNAGTNRDMLAIKMTDEDFMHVIKINLESTFILNRDFVRHMIRNRKGRIINISSVVGCTGNAGQANYAASKAGVIAMSKSLAREVATRGVTINCIAPGFIQTPMTDKLTEDQKARSIASIPAGRFGKPEDVACAAVYLMSDEADYVTGHTIHVNGGMLMV